MKIGFIGVGVMGTPMVKNLKKAGFEVYIYARNINKVKQLENDGVVIIETIKELASMVDVVITIVGMPSDVKEVYFDNDKIIANAKKGTVLIDMTTSSPKLAKEIYIESNKKGLYSLDAPVTGGDIGAKNGTLTIFVGGDYEIYEKCKPIFEAMGKVISYVGESGNGQHAKLANQIAIAGAISAMTESITYGLEFGLNVNELIKVWGSGSAGSWQMVNMGPRALCGDLAPGFFIKHFIKDMNLAIAELKDKNINFKMLTQVWDMFEEMSRRGYESFGTQAIINYYKDIVK